MKICLTLIIEYCFFIFKINADVPTRYYLDHGEILNRKIDFIQ